MNSPKFQGVQLNIMIENESCIQCVEREYKLKQIIEKEGKYP